MTLTHFRSGPPFPIQVSQLFSQFGKVKQEQLKSARCLRSLISLSYFRKLDFLEKRQKNVISSVRPTWSGHPGKNENTIKVDKNTQILAVIIQIVLETFVMTVLGAMPKFSLKNGKNDEFLCLFIIIHRSTNFFCSKFCPQSCFNLNCKKFLS